jgi:hypothetical protein
MKLSVNGVSTTFCLTYWVYQGFTRINELITELFATSIVKNTMYNGKNMDSKLIVITSYTTCTHGSLVVENTILVRYDKSTGKRRGLSDSIDAPARRHTYNPPNSDGLGVVHLTVPGLMVPGY